jgi:hypothetical protein
VFPKALRQHLQRRHRLPVAQRQLLLRHCQSLDLITRPEDLQLPPDHSSTLPFLPVKKGYSCCQCRYLTCSRKQARNHANQVYKLTLQACTNSYHSVQLQSWFSGSRALYWIVRAKATADPAAIGLQKGGDSRLGSAKELEKLEQQEIRRLEQLEQDYIAQEA